MFVGGGIVDLSTTDLFSAGVGRKGSAYVTEVCSEVGKQGEHLPEPEPRPHKESYHKYMR